MSVKNPHTWAYKEYHLGKFVHPIKFSIWTQNFHDREFTQTLTDICRVVGQIAVSSAALTAHQRRKYADKRINRDKGKRVYYLFPCEAIPQDIYFNLEIEEDKFIYA